MKNHCCIEIIIALISVTITESFSPLHSLLQKEKDINNVEQLSLFDSPSSDSKRLTEDHNLDVNDDDDDVSINGKGSMRKLLKKRKKSSKQFKIKVDKLKRKRLAKLKGFLLKKYPKLTGALKSLVVRMARGDKDLILEDPLWMKLGKYGGGFGGKFGGRMRKQVYDQERQARYQRQRFGEGGPRFRRRRTGSGGESYEDDTEFSFEQRYENKSRISLYRLAMRGPLQGIELSINKTGGSSYTWPRFEFSGNGSRRGPFNPFFTRPSDGEMITYDKVSLGTGSPRTYVFLTRRPMDRFYDLRRYGQGKVFTYRTLYSGIGASAKYTFVTRFMNDNVTRRWLGKALLREKLPLSDLPFKKVNRPYTFATRPPPFKINQTVAYPTLSPNATYATRSFIYFTKTQVQIDREMEMRFPPIRGPNQLRPPPPGANLPATDTDVLRRFRHRPNPPRYLRPPINRPAPRGMPIFGNRMRQPPRFDNQRGRFNQRARGGAEFPPGPGQRQYQQFEPKIPHGLRRLGDLLEDTGPIQRSNDDVDMDKEYSADDFPFDGKLESNEPDNWRMENNDLGLESYETIYKKPGEHQEKGAFGSNYFSKGFDNRKPGNEQTFKVKATTSTPA